MDAWDLDADVMAAVQAMTADLWALFAALLLATVQLAIATLLTLRQLGSSRDPATARAR